MIRILKPALIGLALLGVGALLSGCSNFDPENLDLFGWADRKEKLPGERRPLFPEGVPGVTQGVPPDLMKGNQPQPGAEAATPPVQPAEPEPKPQAKPKPKPRVATRPAPQRQAPAQQEQQPQQQQQPAQQSGANAPWPAPSAQQQQPSPWPTAPQSGTFQR